MLPKLVMAGPGGGGGGGGGGGVGGGGAAAGGWRACGPPLSSLLLRADSKCSRITF